MTVVPLGEESGAASRSERRPTTELLDDLAAIRRLAAELDVTSPAQDVDVELTTDDMRR